MSALLVLALIAPLLCAALLALPGRVSSLGARLAPFATLPAVGLALLAPDLALEVPWLLLGTRYALDLPGRILLLAAGILWTLSGLYARAWIAPEGLRRYLAFHLLSATGNIALLVSADVLGFYLAFALMTFSAYGLVVHEGTPAARRAGHVYMLMAVVAEAMLLVALAIAVHHAGTLDLAAVSAALPTAPGRPLVILFILAGFGIKAGAVPLHVWLPLAHPAAPVPASAVLSGAMIKAGLMGWLRFLPLGVASLPGWGAACIALGVVAALFGVIVGVTQREAKTALAYSSISQMGYMNVAVGVGLIAPAAAAATVLACAVYAVHHGLSKGALFLGVGVATQMRRPGWRGTVSKLLMAMPALALAGLPMTSGYLGKLVLKDAAYLASPALGAWVVALMPIAAVGTTLLMARVLLLLDEAAGRKGAGASAPPRALRWAFATTAVAGLVATWAVLLAAGPASVVDVLFAPTQLFTGLWPVAVGLVLVALLRWLARERVGPFVATIAPGDLLLPIEAAIVRVREAVDTAPRDPDRPTRVGRLAARWGGAGRAAGPHDPWRLVEGRLLRWSWAMLGILGVLLVLMLSWIGGPR
jgi:formate hydrogenlyase subunit 3/multisubunit Na+/H+ antiporter MnhD subunit